MFNLARSVGAKWVIILIIYFISLFSLFYIIENVSGIYSLGEGLITSRGGTLDLISSGEVSCIDPRIIPFLEEERKGGIVPENSIKCLDTLGVNDSSLCNYFPGCTWESSSWWERFWFGVEQDTCKGNINFTWLTENDDKWSELTFANFNTALPRPSVCNLQRCQDEPDTCINLGCQLVESLGDEELEELLNPSGFLGVVNSVRNFFRMIVDVFSLRLNFGFQTQFLNTLLGVILIWLPLILLILAFIIIVR